jgi:AcrR family transcriptional regulator
MAKTRNVPDTRDEILAAALEILRSEGHGGLTVRNVATRAGCSTIGVYTWFGGKDGLVDAILLDGYRRFAEALRGSRAARSPLGRLVGQGRAYRRWALEHRTSYEVMFMGAVPGHQPSAEAQAAGLVAFELLRSEVVAAQRAGLIPETDADTVALTMWGLAHGLVSIEIASSGPDSVDGIHAKAFDAALRTIERGLMAER